MPPYAMAMPDGSAFLFSCLYFAFYYRTVASVWTIYILINKTSVALALIFTKIAAHENAMLSSTTFFVDSENWLN
jgi:hypothetical protein